MVNFTRKQLAVAVGGALASLAGGSALAVPAFLSTVDNAAVASVADLGNGAVGTATPTAVFTAAGSAGSVNIQVKFNGVGVSDSTGLHVNDSVSASAYSNADFLITYGTSGRIPRAVITAKDSGGATYADSVGFGTIGGEKRSIIFTLNPGATGAKVRVNNATGAVQWSDTNGANFGDILITVQNGVGSNDTGVASLVDSNGSQLATSLTVTPKTGTTLALTPEIKTRAASGLVNGLMIDFRHPLTAAPATTDIQLYANAQGGVNGIQAGVFGSAGKITAATGVTQTITLGNAFAADSTNYASNPTANTPYYASAGTAPQTSIDIALTGLTSADWTTNGTTQDAAAYTASSGYFNTGVKGAAATMPFKIMQIDSTAGKAFSYLGVFDETTFKKAAYDSASYAPMGTNLTNAALPLDGVLPSVLKAEFDRATGTPAKGTLTVTFSEKLTWFGGTGISDVNEKEVLEQISYTAGTTTTTLAAAAFNSGLGVLMDTAAGGDINTSTSVLTLSNVPGDVLDTASARTLTVNKRISLADPGDGNYVAGTDVLDTAGLRGDTANLPSGYTLANEYVSGTASVGKLVKAVSFAGLTCDGIVASDATKVGSILCVMPGNVQSDSGSLTDRFRVKVTDASTTPYVDSSGGSAANFYFYPDSNQVAVSGANVTITLPTASLTSNITSLTLDYLTAGNWLNDSSGNNVPVRLGMSVNLPFVAANANQMLYTMDAEVKIVGAKSGSRVTTYLAKWFDGLQPSGTPSVDLVTGVITNPGDKLATDISLNWDTGADTAVGAPGKALADLIGAELAKEKPGSVTAYLHLKRSNDTARGGQDGNGNTGTSSNTSVQWAAAKLSANPEKGNHTNTVETVYVVKVDPKTGAITGRLTGSIGIKPKPAGEGLSGLAFLKTDGTFTFGLPDATNAAKSETLANAMANGKTRVLIGTDRNVDPTKLSVDAKDGFLLMVLEDPKSGGVTNRTLITSADPGQSNFVAFTPTLAMLKDVKRTAVPDITLANINKVALTTGTAWQLLGLGTIDRAKVKVGAVTSDVPAAWDAKNLARMFVQMDPNTGGALKAPEAIWTNDVGGFTATQLGKTGDMAMSLVDNVASMAIEGAQQQGFGNVTGGVRPQAKAAALAFKNDGGTNVTTAGTNLYNLYVMTRTSEDPIANLKGGWSLVSFPTAWVNSLPTSIEAVLKVGAGYGTNQQSWFKGDDTDAGLKLNLTANMPAFVFIKK